MEDCPTTYIVQPKRQSPAELIEGPSKEFLCYAAGKNTLHDKSLALFFQRSVLIHQRSDQERRAAERDNHCQIQMWSCKEDFASLSLAHSQDTNNNPDRTAWLSILRRNQLVP